MAYDPNDVTTGEVIAQIREEPIMRFFSFSHLPPPLQEVSSWFAEIATRCMTLPKGAERATALRKILEAKDAAVRAALPPTP